MARSASHAQGRAQTLEFGARAMSELTPRHVLTDLFGGADFDHEILDPERAADVAIERLRAACFEIKPRGPATYFFAGNAHCQPSALQFPRSSGGPIN